MERSRDLKDQMGGLVSEMFLCFQHTLPNRQFQVLLLFGALSLELTLKQLSGSLDLEEKKRLRQEFKRGFNIIKKGIEGLRQTRRELSGRSERRCP